MKLPFRIFLFWVTLPITFIAIFYTKVYPWMIYRCRFLHIDTSKLPWIPDGYLIAVFCNTQEIYSNQSERRFTHSFQKRKTKGCIKSYLSTYAHHRCIPYKQIIKPCRCWKNSSIDQERRKHTCVFFTALWTSSLSIAWTCQMPMWKTIMFWNWRRTDMPIKVMLMLNK